MDRHDAAKLGPRRTRPPAAAALVLGAAAAQAASVGSILAQGSDGSLYLVSTTDASVKKFRTLSDFNDNSADTVNSPNGLGYSKAANTSIRSTFGNQANTLYADDTPLSVTAPPSGGGFSIAAGDVVGDTYYYATDDGQFGTVTDLFGTPTANPTVSFRSGTWGDLAIRGDDLFISEDTTFAQYSLSGLLSGTNAAAINTASVGSSANRFAGLAFDGDKLFGFTANGSTMTNQLFEIALGFGSFGQRTAVGNIALDGVLLTDAAPSPVPLPAAAWMLLAGLGGLAALGRRRAA